MKILKTLAAIIAAAFFLSGAAIAQQAFLNYSGGNVPPGAIPNGQEANGQPLYTCVALYANGSHPGKTRPGLGGCNIGYGGSEITVYDYAVLSGGTNWVVTSGNNIPGNALPGGWESNGQHLFYCRAWHNNGLHPGKTRVGFNGCNIGYGGREIAVLSYEVLLN